MGNVRNLSLVNYSRISYIVLILEIVVCLVGCNRRRIVRIVILVVGVGVLAVVVAVVLLAAFGRVVAQQRAEEVADGAVDRALSGVAEVVGSLLYSGGLKKETGKLLYQLELDLKSPKSLLATSPAYSLYSGLVAKPYNCCSIMTLVTVSRSMCSNPCLSKTRFWGR